MTSVEAGFRRVLGQDAAAAHVRRTRACRLAILVALAGVAAGLGWAIAICSAWMDSRHGAGVGAAWAALASLVVAGSAVIALAYVGERSTVANDVPSWARGGPLDPWTSSARRTDRSALLSAVRWIGAALAECRALGADLTLAREPSAGLGLRVVGALIWLAIVLVPFTVPGLLVVALLS